MEGERTFVTRTQSENIRVTVEGEPIFVIGAGNGLIDGADWQGRIYPAGRHRYNSVGGSVKTVLCFATSPEAAADYLLKNR